MTFDKQKARELTERMEAPHVWATDQYEIVHRQFPLALDRIEELEKALIEERAKTVEVFWHPGFDFVCIEGLKLDEAREQLHAEGLI